jgi:hypothetical protein
LYLGSRIFLGEGLFWDLVPCLEEVKKGVGSSAEPRVLAFSSGYLAFAYFAWITISYLGQSKNLCRSAVVPAVVMRASGVKKRQETSINTQADSTVAFSNLHDRNMPSCILQDTKQNDP